MLYFFLNIFIVFHFQLHLKKVKITRVSTKATRFTLNLQRYYVLVSPENEKVFIFLATYTYNYFTLLLYTTRAKCLKI
jgi:hypothetical protein